MSLPFYRAFEERYRGSRDLIKARLAIYLDFIVPLKNIYSTCPALDLGCGRGEWLELLVENNFSAKGVDLDLGMLEACKALNLPAEREDALAFLSGACDESWAIVSGFHIAEHLPFADLQLLISEALRVLKPAGLLILETPNVENLVVGTSEFYLDPSHSRPIPPQLLTFLTEHSGFKRTKILRLNETSQFIKTDRPALVNVLYGPSPDFAVVAQKNTSDEQLALFNAPFEKNYGYALSDLALKYDNAQNQSIDSVNIQLTHLYSQTMQLGQKTESIQEAMKSISHHFQQQLNEMQLNYEAKLHELLSSTSWRITRPIRALKSITAWRSVWSGSLARSSIRKVAVTAARKLYALRPALLRKAANLIRRHPRLFAHLRQFALHHGIIITHPSSMLLDRQARIDQLIATESDLKQLSPHARGVYSSLRRALSQKEGA